MFRLFTIAAVLILVTGGVFAWQQGWFSPQETSEEPGEFDISGWQTYRNDGLGYSTKEGRGFEFKYPAYFSKNFIEGSTREYFQVSGERPEGLRVQVHLQDLDGFNYVNQPGAFSFTYDASSGVWEPSEVGVPQDFAPKKRVSENGLVYYSVETGDAAASIQTVFVPYSREDIVVEITLSRNESYRDCIQPCPEEKPFSDKTTVHQILSTFRFVDIQGLNKEQALSYLANVTGFGYGVEWITEVNEIGDVNNDGYNEFFVTASGSGGTCVGGTNYKVLYSPQKQEYFVGARSLLPSLPSMGREQTFCTIIEKGNIWEACAQGYYLDYVCFSNNLKETENTAFKVYLENVLGDK